MPGERDRDLAFAYEALARARAIAGDAGQAREYTDRVLAAGDEERDLVLVDLETISRPAALIAAPYRSARRARRPTLVSIV